MGKNAYLVVTDLHLSYKNLRNRLDYREEMNNICKELLSLATTYSGQGYEVTLLLLGDVFHRSYNNIFNACNDNNFFYLWHQTFGKIYSVVGNHELSYYQSNPFYTLVSDIKSDRVRGIMNRVWHPVGSSGVIEVVDTLQDGEVNFIFNHYSTGIAAPEPGMKNIGLFHTDLVSPEILQTSDMRSGLHSFANPVDIEGSNILNGYDYCFFGHLHTIYGTFIDNNGTYLCYLASLGRTNVNEVSDTFLERNVPVICIEDGLFTRADDNKFFLRKRADCIKESALQETQEQAEVQREKIAIKSAVSVGDDPIENVKALLTKDALAFSIFENILQSGVDAYGIELTKEISDTLQKSLL